MKKNIIRSLGASMAVVLAVAGVGTASAESYSNMGQGSYGHISNHNLQHRHHKHPLARRSVTINNNINVANVRVTNDVSQFAQSGNASVRGSKFGGTALSGNASNSSNISTRVNINQR